jgi:hypothetical protein
LRSCGRSAARSFFMHPRRTGDLPVTYPANHSRPATGYAATSSAAAPSQSSSVSPTVSLARPHQKRCVHALADIFFPVSGRYSPRPSAATTSGIGRSELAEKHSEVWLLAIRLDRAVVPKDDSLARHHRQPSQACEPCAFPSHIARLAHSNARPDVLPPPSASWLQLRCLTSCALSQPIIAPVPLVRPLARECAASVPTFAKRKIYYA